ncbi:MAG: sugar ABC transporter substrate-binding protein [Clostridiaceae bacterium]|nr:sugar ABC transporter substrate-binding protein [Clostridiaceae bacterium]
MKKITGVVLIFMVCTALLLTGCSNAGSRKTTFTFATWAAGVELQEFNEIIDRVNQKADGKYKIEVLSVPSDYYVKLSTYIAAKKTPDFFWLTQELISKYAKMGAITDITDKLESSSNLTKEQYYPGVLKSAMYEGRCYGLPWIANPLIVFYNQDLFDEAGIPYPSPDGEWTWDEFIDIAKRLTTTKADAFGNEYKQYGYVVDGWPNIETFIWAGGGDIIAENGVDILLDSQESINGLAILSKILKADISPSYSEVSSLGSNNVWFEKQRAAMFMGGIQDNFETKVSEMPESEQFRIGYAPMPVGLDNKSHSFNWTASTVMSRQLAENPLAYEVMETITLEFFRWKIAPPIMGEIDQVAEINPLKEPALNTIQICLNNARSANYIPEWNEINNSLWLKLYSKILNDPDFDYENEAKAIAREARELIAQRK